MSDHFTTLRSKGLNKLIKYCHKLMQCSYFYCCNWDDYFTVLSVTLFWLSLFCCWKSGKSQSRYSQISLYHLWPYFNQYKGIIYCSIDTILLGSCSKKIDIWMFGHSQEKNNPWLTTGMIITNKLKWREVSLMTVKANCLF